MIIGVSGYARSGKDEVAKILMRSYDYRRGAFADPIREFVLRVNPLLPNGLDVQHLVKVIGWEGAKAQPECRRILQEIGTVARQMFGENFWVDQLWKTVQPNEKIVITDVRFKNEADFIKSQGGEVWRVHRPGVGPVNNHISERDLDNYNFDVVIRNESSLEALEAVVNEVMRADKNS